MKLIYSLEKIVVHSHSFKFRIINKNGKNIIMTYSTAEYNNFKEQVSILTKKQLSRNFEIINEAVALEISIFYKIPKSYSKVKKQECANKPKITRPDVDNVAKSLLDALSGVVYVDDALITSLKLSKQYGPLEQEEEVKAEIGVVLVE